MIIRRFLLLLCLLTAFGASVFAQQDSIPLTTIIEKTSKFNASFPIEKVYLHTDKPYYAVGDTIWFKAYVTIEKHQPSALSRIVYVDLINNRDSVVESQRIALTNGFASGNIVLNGDTYKQGAYRLRSYTGWMRNFDPDYFYDHTFNVGNAIDNQVRTNITYKSSTKRTGVKVDATILYKGSDNSPYANKKVSWQLMKNGDPVSKGRGTTDDKGVLQVDLPESQADVITGGILVTAIDVGDRKTISSSFSMRTAVKAYDVQFFPEGGQLTNGVRTKVAFKAIASSGLGVDIKGTVVDDKGTEIAQISSAHLGMGVFAIAPDIE
ncbi:MAG: carboxypeptidase regulatory-like protein, partial [Mucilaginibacter sp.]|nr:carboxypeptidase regulatory-like protein [Mucilaginibacter sp.]